MESGAAKGRKKPPQWFLDEPILLPGDAFYLHEFWILDTCRPAQGRPIPVTEIERRAMLRHGFDGSALELYEAVLRAMDDGYLEWQRENAPKPPPPPSKPAPERKRKG